MEAFLTVVLITPFGWIGMLIISGFTYAIVDAIIKYKCAKYGITILKDEDEDI